MATATCPADFAYSDLMQQSSISNCFHHIDDSQIRNDVDSVHLPANRKPNAIYNWWPIPKQDNGQHNIVQNNKVITS